ncbi:D-glucuronyl C5-epimerase [Halotydeus destructor]|nr:D-glucuronyl C5-epimerase [Halotydeus destructor]
MKLRSRKLIGLVLFSTTAIFIGWTILSHGVEKIPEKTLTTDSTVISDELAKHEAAELTDDEDFSDNMPAVGESYSRIECVINDEFSVGCLKAETSDGSEFFDWQHSYSRVYYPSEPYHHRGAYLWFENYNVEVRDRVKYVSAKSGVPVSSQWKADGHYYPVQIAQFGLSHFSKNLTTGKRRVTELEDGRFNEKSWNLLEKSRVISTVRSEENSEVGKNVLLVDGKNVIFNVKKRKSNDLNLVLHFKPLQNTTVILVLQSLSPSDKKEYRLYYSTVAADYIISGSNLHFGLGNEDTWKYLRRDITVDLNKSQNILNNKLMPKIRNVRLARVVISGKILISQLYLTSNLHIEYFDAAAEWFVANQNLNGGWAVQVARKLSNGELTLKAGWYSAMAQGQAISLLCRKYHVSRDENYLNAAIKALHLFTVNATDNGVRAYFMNQNAWYEEYPTTPSSFVLNGFMYSLFGLYDLKMTCSSAECDLAHSLYEEGLSSLKKMLLLYDTGSGTVYDLRHASLGTAPNLARWDYHSTHINQLLYLDSIENNPLFQTTAKRWVSYMKGKRAPHN